MIVYYRTFEQHVGDIKQFWFSRALKTQAQIMPDQTARSITPHQKVALNSLSVPLFVFAINIDLVFTLLNPNSFPFPKDFFTVLRNIIRKYFFCLALF